MNRRQFARMTGLIAASGAVGMLGSSASAAENGVVLDLNPNRDNPRNSEGAFIALKSGRLLFLYSRFHGGANDASPARIVSIHSDDHGQSWSKEPQTVAENTEGANG